MLELLEPRCELGVADRFLGALGCEERHDGLVENECGKA